MPQARGGRLQIGITAALKPEQDDGLAGVCQPRECSRERLGTPEIVGQVDNPVLETVRRLWWREFDRVCYCFVLTRVSIVDRVYRPKPPTSADLQREANHERLVRAFPAAAEAIEPGNAIPCKSRRRSGSPYR